MPDFTTTDGTRLHYSNIGDGPVTLCLAGLTRNSVDFQHVLPHLSGRILCMNYRGRGKSDWADPATYTIPQEAHDALALLDHLDIPSANILGTSRGGLIAMVIAATAKDRLTGVALNDIGPELGQAGLDVIRDYIGITPPFRTYAEAAEARAKTWTQFRDVPMSRWLAEVEAHYIETPDGLTLRYDPALRDAVLAAGEAPLPDMWPLFDALDGLPLALIRGANSDLLCEETTRKMQTRRPDMRLAIVPDRGHVPFLDEPAALAVLRDWQADIAKDTT